MLQSLLPSDTSNYCTILLLNRLAVPPTGTCTQNTAASYSNAPYSRTELKPACSGIPVPFRSLQTCSTGHDSATFSPRGHVSLPFLDFFPPRQGQYSSQMQKDETQVSGNQTLFSNVSVLHRNMVNMAADVDLQFIRQPLCTCFQKTLELKHKFIEVSLFGAPLPHFISPASKIVFCHIAMIQITK